MTGLFGGCLPATFFGGLDPGPLPTSKGSPKVFVRKPRTWAESGRTQAGRFRSGVLPSYVFNGQLVLQGCLRISHICRLLLREPAIVLPDPAGQFPMFGGIIRVVGVPTEGHSNPRARRAKLLALEWLWGLGILPPVTFLSWLGVRTYDDDLMCDGQPLI